MVIAATRTTRGNIRGGQQERVERYPRDAWMSGAEMHTVAHAASYLGRGAVAGGLLNGCLGLDAVGATNRVEDAWLGFQALG
eukprot:scaffold75982_cov65-Phaeocystis_antarctica.AAC.6